MAMKHMAEIIFTVAIVAVIAWTTFGGARFDCYVGHIERACAEIGAKY